MRSSVLRSRIKTLIRASSLGAAGVLVAGCSSGFERFDHYYRSATPQQQAAQSYPGVDSTTTASSGAKLSPLTNVQPIADPQAVYHRPEPTYAAPNAQTYSTSPQPYRAPAATQPYQAPVSTPTYQTSQYQAPQYQTPQYQAPAIAPQSQPYLSANANRQPLSSYRPTVQAPQQTAPVRVASTPVSQSKVIEGPAYAPPKPDVQSKTVYIPPSSADSLTTASVQSNTLTPVAASSREDGWTKAGGTTIVARSGETLYNLSKRYGVPVDAIRSANNMSSDQTLQAGQRILIPNYVFSPTSPVSAPDHDKDTRAARASTGYVGEADPRNVAVPTVRPYYVSAVQPSPSVPQRYTAPVQNTITQVQPVEDPNDPGIDPVVTSSVAAKVLDTAKAPASTGISNFRWPVNGRVVSEFNARTASGKNEGIDISVPEGTAVKAAENGVVIYAGSEISSYGNLILIRHADDWVSAYAHNKEFSVRKGERVNRGQTIARSGKTGDTDRPKLHFELRKNSVPVNPKTYLSGA